MINSTFNFLGTVFVVTAIGIALRPNAPTAKVIQALTAGIANMQTAAFGPK